MFKVLILILLLIVIAILGIFATMWLWTWIVPDVFSGAVNQGILPATITFVQAVKLLILPVALGIGGRSGSK